MKEELLDYRLKGYCCGQIITDMCLKRMGKENPDMVEASAGMCLGAWQPKTCGALTAAICMLFLYDPQEANDRNVQEIIDWFEATFGTTDCETFLEGNPINKIEKCPVMMEALLDELFDIII